MEGTRLMKNAIGLRLVHDEAASRPQRPIPLQDEIDGVRAALHEAEASTDLEDLDGMTLVRSLRDCLDGLLAEQAGGPEPCAEEGRCHSTTCGAWACARWSSA